MRTAGSEAINLKRAMASGTSPSLQYNGTIAAQASTGELVERTTGGLFYLGLGMLAGTSPSITAEGEIAFQANGGELWVRTAGSEAINLKLGMASGTGPSEAN